MAMFKKIKIAHIHGGEVSAGAMDEKSDIQFQKCLIYILFRL